MKLPTEIFYRTGIATYIWVLNNHKPENRKGYVQLIDASEEKTALRKSQGNKRYEIGEDQAAWIVRTYVDGHDHGRSVIVPVENFMYRKVTTQRPLRVVIEPSVDGLDALFTLSKPMEKLSDASRAAIRSWVEKNEGASLTGLTGSHTTFRSTKVLIRSPQRRSSISFIRATVCLNICAQS